MTGQNGRATSNAPNGIVREHLLITTSGVCDNALRWSIDTPTAHRIMVSMDYPYANTELAGRWINQAPIDPQTKTMICRITAQTAIRISPDQGCG